MPFPSFPDGQCIECHQDAQFPVPEPELEACRVSQREAKVDTTRSISCSLIGGGTIGLLSKIPNLDISLKGDLGLIGFGASAVLLLAVSSLDLKWSSLRNTR